jgi:hypothetical protein
LQLTFERNKGEIADNENCSIEVYDEGEVISLHIMKAYGGSKGTTPLILKLCNR